MSDARGSRIGLWIVIGGGAFFLFVLAVFTLVYLTLRTTAERTEYGGGGGRIAVVDLDGVILSPDATVRELKRFADDSSIQAIILRVNTPGGSAAGSEEIYRSVRRIRDAKKKPIVASIGIVGASGGYYVSAGTSKIFANDASIVGSIGVISEYLNYGDLLRWAKLQVETLKTGEFKDTGNPARPLTPAERVYLQGILSNMLGQFVQAVADGRKLKVEDVRALADGKVWTGQQALALHLVDQIGDFDAAVKDTAKSVGIRGEPTLVRAEKPRRSLLDLLFGDASDLLPSQAKLMERNIGFYYLWK